MSDESSAPVPSIPFNRPYMTGNELAYIAEAHSLGHLAGNGTFSQRCAAWLEERIGSRKALLTHSATGALEMAALLSEVGPGDEVIMPSFTFVSTANAFAGRGATPVFVDIRPDTLNMNEELIEAAITLRTKAIVPVHYAGVACEMRPICEVALARHVVVIEDAAQGLLASYRGRPVGGIGQLAALSFHETKNVISGEGGALLINDPSLESRGEVIWEKGTNRTRFFRGEVDKYTWVDLGSSFLPGEIVAAFLWAQLEQADDITARRRQLWTRYHEGLADLERQGRIRRPHVPNGSDHNAHLYYILLPSLEARTNFIALMKARGIHPVFHYVPLHDSPFGAKVGRAVGSMAITQDVSERLVRLPLWIGLDSQLDRVIDTVIDCVLKTS